ncbi:hypothetical protein FVEG_16015 [Fusarium verticillioides 7600]|uniref:Uncharacterized protein n=1 Tax=Gibberella moniliformis (strain M3125 / FGSC 7600) TaxID=334819 RepID=W7MGR6_GIBM7|nr:hypothetical protein FVEG_16015 [Fusarium verticillioides 7600]XP_018752947.1 hypothetical protein FVEG_16015 [Fusarium verticillioides 7600]EWG46755.1 hypothetical protein FVEG_16015 [Fusarium verticillioides 7600]EWG46756.1 hypothetical protein FVEG_16015 [Fusarium verticillioides 7600]
MGNDTKGSQFCALSSLPSLPRYSDQGCKGNNAQTGSQSNLNNLPMHNLIRSLRMADWTDSLTDLSTCGPANNITTTYYLPSGRKKTSGLYMGYQNKLAKGILNSC